MLRDAMWIEGWLAVVSIAMVLGVIELG